MAKKKERRIRFCTVDFKPIGPSESHTSIPTTGGTFYFHHECYRSLCDRRGRRIPSKFLHAVMEFSRQGFKPTILKSEYPARPKANITAFEPEKYDKLDQLDMIIECLQFYKKPMTRNDISKETLIPKGTVTWRIWDNLEGKSKTPLFYVDPIQKGPRGMELVGLVEKS